MAEEGKWYKLQSITIEKVKTNADLAVNG